MSLIAVSRYPDTYSSNTYELMYTLYPGVLPFYVFLRPLILIFAVESFILGNDSSADPQAQAWRTDPTKRKPCPSLTVMVHLSRLFLLRGTGTTFCRSVVLPGRMR